MADVALTSWRAVPSPDQMAHRAVQLVRALARGWANEAHFSNGFHEFAEVTPAEPEKENVRGS